MTDAAVQALEWGVLFVALLLTLALFATWYVAKLVGSIIAIPLRQIPAIGGAIGSWVEGHIQDLGEALYGALIGWYQSGANPLWSMMSESSRNQRTVAFQALTTQGQVIDAIGYVVGNTVDAPTTQTQPAVQQSIAGAITKLEFEMVGIANRAIEISETYTYSTGEWAFGQFQAINAYENGLNGRLATGLASAGAALQHVRNETLTAVQQAAAAQRSHTDAQVQSLDTSLTARLAFVEAEALGAVADVDNTAKAGIAALTDNLGAFETGVTGYLVAHAIPAVAEIERVGFRCLDNLCGGQGAIDGLLKTLLGLAGEGLLFAMLADAIADPKSAAPAIAEGISAISELPINIYDTITRQHL